MDLSTTWLGLELQHPLVPGASPLADELETVRKLEDAGAAAIVLRSLFEEQIAREQHNLFLHTELHGEAFAEAMSYFPNAEAFVLGPEDYANHLRRVKQAVAVPVIGSLNGTTRGGWLDYARLIEQAGADALELNVYHVATDPRVSGAELERTTLEMVREVKRAVAIPVAVKLSPFFSSFAHFAHQLEHAGADGLVLFNRFYQPDIDVQELAVERTLQLSDSSELLLRLRWLAVLSGRLDATLAVSGGVHTAIDVVKSVMAGAHCVQLVSALLRHGPDHLRRVREELVAWMEKNEWDSLAAMRGNMNLARCPDPKVYERANYMMMLQSWRA